MDFPSINVRRLTLLGVVLLTPGFIDRSADAGDFFKKKSQLIAVPVAQAAAPVLSYHTMPTQPAQVSVFQLSAAPSLVSVPVMQAPAQPTAQVHLQPQAAPSTPPAIHITVIEAESHRASSTPQAAPSAQASVQQATQFQAITMQPQVMMSLAPVVSQAILVPQATPVQLYAVPASPQRSWFKKH